MIDPQVDGEELFDDDIIEIFIEEAEEVIETINSLYPNWHSDPGNKECLEEIRRAFHTLKGSGRMVQADEISGLAKAMEDVLEKSISGAIMINNSLIELVDRVRVVIPSLIDSFKNRVAVDEGLGVNILIEHAEALGRGESVSMAALVRTDDVSMHTDSSLHTAASLDTLDTTDTFDSIATAASLETPASLENDYTNGMAEYDPLPPVLNMNEGDSNNSGSIDFISPLDWEDFKERVSSMSEAVEELSLSFSALKDDVEILKSHSAADENDQATRERVSNQINVFDKELQDLKYFLKASTQKLTAEFNELSDETVERVNQQLESFDIKSDKLQQELYKSRSLIDSSQIKIIGWSVGSAVVSCAVAITAAYFLLS